MTRTALHARYATFVPIATIRVQKKKLYASSGN